MQATDLPPFAEACRNQIEALMTAHVVYPALDAKLPATLSEAIVTGLLRHQLGFDGVIFSDDLAMRAISDRYGVEEATALAIRAGVDVLLFCHEIDQAVVAFEFLCDEADRDAAVRARIEESYRRVTRTQAAIFDKLHRRGRERNRGAARRVEPPRVAQCLRMKPGYTFELANPYQFVSRPSTCLRIKSGGQPGDRTVSVIPFKNGIQVDDGLLRRACPLPCCQLPLDNSYEM